MTLRIIMLFYYSEFCILFTIMLNVFMLSVLMLNVIMLSVVAPVILLLYYKSFTSVIHYRPLIGASTLSMTTLSIMTFYTIVNKM
jgi:hypothetical protein